MQYMGDKNETTLKGTLRIEPNTKTLALYVEDDEGKDVHFAVSVGKLLPTNWVGKRVSVTTKLLDDKPEKG